MEREVTNYTNALKHKYNWSEIIGLNEVKGKSSAYPSDYANELVRQGNISKLKTAIKKGLKINQANEIGIYPIHEAVKTNNMPMLELLLTAGADIETRIHPFAHTPLYIAVEKGYYEIAKFLIRKNAKLYVTDRLSGRTLLHLAAKNNDEEMAELLINFGVNTLICDKQELTARDIAAKNNNKALEKTLLKAMQQQALLLEI